MFIFLLILFSAIGIGLGLLYNKLVISEYPEITGKGKFVATVILFLIVTVLVFGVAYGRASINKSLSGLSSSIQETLKEKHSNIDFVNNGLDVSALNNNLDKVNAAVADLNKVLWPYAEAYGAPKLVYDAAVGYITKSLQVKLFKVNAAGKAANAFIDNEGYLTVSSILNAFQAGLMRVVSVIAIILIIIILSVLIFYIIKTLPYALDVKKKRKESGAA
ncbi:MAG: hypothetical protein FWD22_05635 [Treponema sp.]|nr:hypothetical protein [Treponema sp.]